MKIKNLVLAIIIMMSGNVIFAQKVEINTKKSSIEWLGKKIVGEHKGNIQLKSGSLELNKTSDPTLTHPSSNLTKN